MDKIESMEEAIIEIYRRLRSGDPPTWDTAIQNFDAMLKLPEIRDLDGVVIGRVDLTGSLGLTREAAARFSFLLAVPVGLLVGAKQLVDLARGVPLGVSPAALAIGVTVSALAGWAVIAFLLAWLRRRSLVVFGVYRLLLGAALFLLYASS